jgi:hypothetical protein
MAIANLENDAYFLRLVEEGYFTVSKDGTVTNTKTKYVIGSKQKGIDYIGVRHQDQNKTMRNIQAHRLVWLVYGGKIEDPSLIVNHKDLNKRNNAFSNLELITKLENENHAREFYEPVKGEAVHNSAFSDAEVIWYRKCWQQKQISVKQIMAEKSVSRTTVYSMLNGDTYSHL